MIRIARQWFNPGGDMYSLTRPGIFLLLAISAALLAACTVPDGEDQGVASQAASAEQQAALEDGEISEDEYRVGFQRFQACLADLGYEILMQADSNRTFQYSVPAAAVDDGSDAICYEREFHQIDQLWQIAHEDTSRSADVIRDCLEAHGITPENTLAEMVGQLEDAGIDQSECAT